MSNVKTAIQIFRILLEKGQLDRDEYADLFVEYLNSDIQDILSNFEEEMDCRIIRVNNTVYLLPNYDNSLLGFKNKDFRDKISGGRLSDVYLSYYIIMFILFEFYGGKNKNPKRREFLRISTLIDDLDKRFEALLSEEDEVIKTEEEYGINLISIADVWNQKLIYEENKRTTKYGTVIRVCNILEQENLIKLVDEKKEIRTRKKLDDLMTYYFLNDDRIAEINSIFTIEEEKYASNQ